MSKKSKALVGLAAGAMIVYRTFVRPWQQRWGATSEEVNGPLLGDDLIAGPASQITRAITIAASPHAVWSWVIQLGADRGGFYSYDWLEDLFRLGIHSANDVVAEWQSRAAGDFVYGDAKGRGGWYVMDVQPNRALVLQTADLKNARPATRSHRAFMEFTWAFVLNEGSNSTTRLLVRERVAFRNGLSRFLVAPVGLVSFVMTQKMMRGIKERAESRPEPTATPALGPHLVHIPSQNVDHERETATSENLV